MELTRLILIAFIFGACNGSEKIVTEVDAAELRLEQNGGIVYQGEEIFSGLSISHYPNTTIKSHSIAYQDGKKDGIYQKWYPNGTLSYEAQYSNGKKHGISQTWWKDGTLRSKSNFLNGVLEGKQEQWYRSGAKFKVLNYHNGKEEGMQQAWRENGKIYNNYEAKNGRIFGLKRANLCFQLEDESIVTSTYDNYDEIQD